MRNLFLLSFCLLLVVSCRNERAKPDVSNMQLDIKIKRFERDLFSTDSVANDSLLVSKLSGKYGSFWIVYTGNIMRLGDPSAPQFSMALSRFLSDPSMNELYRDCQQKYPTLSQQEKDLSMAFKYYKYYFPDKLVPEVLSFVSGFSIGIAALDSTIGIALDMYLGSDYNKYPFPEYQKQRMRPENIVPDCMYSWLSTEFEFNAKNDDFLNNMIYEGKMMYLLDLTLPDLEDSLKIAYSRTQLEWCEKNEADIWRYFIDNNLLYSTNKMEFYKKYFSEAPFTSGFPQDSPGKVGVWLGWQIIRSYMKNNSEKSILDLLNETDGQLILRDSKYKP